MRSELRQRVRERVTPDQKIYVYKMMDLVVRIDQALAAKEWKKKDLAEALGKSPSEISKWLNGHNLTIRTLAKLEAVLGEELLVVTKPSSVRTDFLPLYISRTDMPDLVVAKEPEVPSYEAESSTKQYLKIA